MKLRTLATALVVGAVVAASCRDATQIHVRVVTTMSCPGGAPPALAEASVLAGPLRRVEGPIQASTIGCEEPGTPNYVGDIVVYPQEDKDGSAEVWVVAALEVDPRQRAEDCLSAYEDAIAEGDPDLFPATCVIAKRRLGFVPHEGLEITVLLDADCAGKACDPDTTCYKRDACVDSNAGCDADGTCMLDAEGMGGAASTSSASASASGMGVSGSSGDTSSADASSSAGPTSSASSSSGPTTSSASSSSGPSSSASSSSASSSSASSSTGGGNPCDVIPCANLAGCQQCCSQSGLGVGGCNVASQLCECMGASSSASSSSSSSVASGAASSSASSSSTTATGGMSCPDGAVTTAPDCGMCFATCGALGCATVAMCLPMPPTGVTCVCAP